MTEIQKKSSVNDTDEHEVCPKFWYVLETRMNHEKKVRSQLEKMGVECFLPSQEIERQWKYRKKKIEQLVIPMKIFVHIEKTAKLKVLQLTSVSRFMRDRKSSTSVIIPDRQMDQFISMVTSSNKTVEFCNGRIDTGVHVRVKSGPLSGLEGCIISQSGRTKLRVEISALGGGACVEISREDVENIKQN